MLLLRAVASIVSPALYGRDRPRFPYLGCNFFPCLFLALYAI
jgi:hypothetical protein